VASLDDAGNVWEEIPAWGGGVGARRVVRAPGGTLGASLWEFGPGASQFVYHFHHGTEELLIVLRGRPTVRLHDGDRVLAEGDVVPFPRGPEGGHTPSSTRGLTREPQQSSATRHSLLGTAA